MPLMTFTEHPALLFALLLFLLATFAWTAYRAFRGPLSHIPGPAISRWTNWRLKIAVLQGERARYVHTLHERYGRIVRISPNEVSLSDINAARTIYRVGSPYVKSSWYDDFTGNTTEKSMFSATDPKLHSQLRKVTAANFSEKWVAKMEPFIAKNTQLAANRMLDEAKQNGYCDLFRWFTAMATDVIGEASFGESFRVLETGVKDQYILDLETVGSKGMIRAEFMPLFKALAKIPFGPAKEMYAIVTRLRKYAEDSLNRYWTQLRIDPENVKPTLLTNEYALVDSGEITFGQINRDATGYIVAGTDTTAITATYAVYLLSHHPELEHQLIRRVSSLPTGFTDHDLKEIDLLQNVINETLRLRGAVAQGLPRVVPPGGAEFCSYYIPGGSVCAIQSYTMHRDPTVWTRPESFEPARWQTPTKEMLHSYYPFGGGSRVCIGQHFAQLEMRHALANFYRNFSSGVQISNAQGFSGDEMVPMSYFLEPPKGKRCLVEARKGFAV